MNKVILMGRLTADPELKQTTSGISVCNITIAVDRSYVPQGQERQADFIPIVLWRQTAEFVCKYFQKGKMIAVEGSMRVRSYNDTRHPEVRHYVTEVFGDNVYFTGDKQQGVNNGGNQYPNNSYQNQPQQIPQYSAPPAASAPAPSISVGDLGDFEEVIGDSDLPF
ncbi:MAG: single-stranded DNA-binding protein [Oscillospiraceae bacterium]|nr:single-stranded DNA-binding protein [Oscillospiraceae bacterium]